MTKRFGPTHELKSPINYQIAAMRTCVKGERTAGITVHILEYQDELMAILPADDYNLTRYLAVAGTEIVGRGVLIEKLWVDEWFVAWRPFYPKPEAIEWER